LLKHAAPRRFYTYFAPQALAFIHAAMSS
jgi:hypothetical protein